MDYKIEYHQYALAQRVLAVAKVKSFNGKLMDWAVYVDAVPGENHDNEYVKVTTHGSKLYKAMAVFMFPGLPADKYRR